MRRCAQTARAFAAKLKESGVDFQLEVYATGVHGFFNQLIKPEGQDLVQRECHCRGSPALSSAPACLVAPAACTGALPL